MKLEATINGQVAEVEFTDDALAGLVARMSQLGQRMNQKQIAAAMGKHPETIRRWMRKRKLSYARIGREVEIDLREVQALRDSHTVSARR